MYFNTYWKFKVTFTNPTNMFKHLNAIYLKFTHLKSNILSTFLQKIQTMFNSLYVREINIRIYKIRVILWLFT